MREDDRCDAVFPGNPHAFPHRKSDTRLEVAGRFGFWQQVEVSA